VERISHEGCASGDDTSSELENGKPKVDGDCPEKASVGSFFGRVTVMAVMADVLLLLFEYSLTWRIEPQPGSLLKARRWLLRGDKQRAQIFTKRSIG